jgi:hypothetical protein
MSSTPPPGADEHDPELSRFLDAIIDLSAGRYSRGPDEFLTAIEGLAENFRALARYRTDTALGQRLQQFVRKRFDLVDDPSEYALAWEEVMVLAMALERAAPLLFPALKRLIERISALLGEEDMPALFGQMLKHTRQLARQHGDAELAAWVQGVVNALPGD